MIRAGERLFAREGIDGVRTRDLVAEAGQANDSAVTYHFGSRQGLLLAVVDKHLRRMEEQWKPAFAAREPDADLGELVTRIVTPLAEQLRTEDGRDFLRITAQLAGRSGVRTANVPEPLTGTALAQWLAELERCCAERLPRTIARERIALLITMLTAALADRARRIEQGSRLPVGHKTFLETLIGMLAAGLAA